VITLPCETRWTSVGWLIAWLLGWFFSHVMFHSSLQPFFVLTCLMSFFLYLTSPNSLSSFLALLLLHPHTLTTLYRMHWTGVSLLVLRVCSLIGLTVVALDIRPTKLPSSVPSRSFFIFTTVMTDLSLISQLCVRGDLVLKPLVTNPATVHRSE